jgi:hypothetical protein
VSAKKARGHPPFELPFVNQFHRRRLIVL